MDPVVHCMERYNGHKATVLTLTALFALTIITSGCGTPYKKIPFAWTSDHRIPPRERILQVKAPPRETFDALQAWAKAQQCGTIVRNESDYRYAYEVHPQGEQKFKALQELTQKYWKSYDENAFMERDAAEWAKLKEHTEGQISKLRSDVPGFALEVRMGERTGTIVESTLTGFQQTSPTMYVAPVTAYQSTGSGIRTVHVPGAVIPGTSTPTFSERSEKMDFTSDISFFIFRRSDGTFVYAVGKPVTGAGLQPSFDKEIDHGWWPQVTGEQEAALIKEAFAYLAALDKTGELERFRPETTLNRNISEKLIAEIPDIAAVRTSLQLSPDNLHAAYKTKAGSQWRAVIDGKEEKQYDDVGDALLFSRDSRRTAYKAKTGTKWFIVIDGKEGKQYDDVGMPAANGRVSAFSPDSVHAAYRAKSGTKWFIVMDGKEEKHYDDVGIPVFSPDSARLAHRAKAGAKWLMVIDGREGKQYDEIIIPVFSPDSKRVAYAARSGSKWFMVIDGKEEKKYASIGLPIFSPDSKRLTYGATAGDEWFAVIDGKEGKHYDGSHGVSGISGFTIFSPNSAHVAYRAKTGTQWFAVIDGQEGKHYDNVGELVFSPDSSHVAYTAKEGKRRFVVIDGKEERQYDDVGKPVFSPDSKHAAYKAFKCRKWLVVVNGKENQSCDDIISISPVFHSPDNFFYVARKSKGIYAVEERIK